MLLTRALNCILVFSMGSFDEWMRTSKVPNHFNHLFVWFYQCSPIGYRTRNELLFEPLNVYRIAICAEQHIYIMHMKYILMSTGHMPIVIGQNGCCICARVKMTPGQQHKLINYREIISGYDVICIIYSLYIHFHVCRVSTKNDLEVVGSWKAIFIRLYLYKRRRNHGLSAWYIDETICLW